MRVKFLPRQTRYPISMFSEQLFLANENTASKINTYTLQRASV